MNQKLKICGVRSVEMLNVCLKNNVKYLGINFVPSSRRCVGADFFEYLKKNFSPDKGRLRGVLQKSQLVALFMNQSLDEIFARLESGIFGVAQLHGDESPDFCAQIHKKFPKLKIWKALKIGSDLEKNVGEQHSVPNQNNSKSVGANSHSPLQQDFAAFEHLKSKILNYKNTVDSFLFDGPKPGSGQTADFTELKKVTDFCYNLNNKFEPTDQIQASSSNLDVKTKRISYGIAGGINPDNISDFRTNFPQADFFDIASGVEVDDEFCERELKKIPK